VKLFAKADQHGRAFIVKNQTTTSGNPDFSI